MTTEQIIWVIAKLVRRQLGWLEFLILLGQGVIIVLLWMLLKEKRGKDGQ